jgi:3-phenylpropionate/trans-cinnamate dioxygenase ferredoxin component
VDDQRLVDVMGASDLAPGTMKMTEVDGVPILLVNVVGTVHAVQGACTHEYWPLDRGELDGSTLMCAMHFSEFDLRDGSVVMGPAGMPLATYPVEIADGRIRLRLPIGTIPVNE